MIQATNTHLHRLSRPQWDVKSSQFYQKCYAQCPLWFYLPQTLDLFRMGRLVRSLHKILRTNRVGCSKANFPRRFFAGRGATEFRCIIGEIPTRVPGESLLTQEYKKLLLEEARQPNVYFLALSYDGCLTRLTLHMGQRNTHMMYLHTGYLRAETNALKARTHTHVCCRQRRGCVSSLELAYTKREHQRHTYRREPPHVIALCHLATAPKT